jgi:3-deoxy-D-manno-octulosonic-acid transferase
MNPAFLPYRAAQRILRGVAPMLGRGDSKLARGIVGRRGAAARLVGWGKVARDAARPGAWLHAPSVGEGLQARAVLDAWRALRPELQVLYTHFSPSAEELARRMPADVAGYLPWDLPGEMARVLEAAAPDVLVFTKTEAWPVLVDQAARQAVPVALVGGTVPPGAGRSRWPARTLLRPMWRRMSLVGAIGEEDAEGFRALGVREDALRVTGDPGIDSAAQRARAADPAAPWIEPFHRERRPTLVAGSTWPADDAVLLPALERVRGRVPELRAVLAPHEPSERHVRELADRLEGGGWRVATLSEVEARGGADGADAVVVDRVGVLAQLYTIGDAAYVGGGFHDAGLHSVLEPAAAALPVAFGPRHENARAAGELLAAGGAHEAGDAGGLAETLTRWLSDDEARRDAGERNFGYIQRHLGAAERSASLLDELLPQALPRP